MSNYEKVDDKYFQALMFGDDLTDAELYPQSVWDAYQELLTELRRARLSASVDENIKSFIKSGILEV